MVLHWPFRHPASFCGHEDGHWVKGPFVPNTPPALAPDWKLEKRTKRGFLGRFCQGDPLFATRGCLRLRYGLRCWGVRSCNMSMNVTVVVFSLEFVSPSR